jgi:predicted house-cleaning noncanonical NTP pyrophosphatase (MazG superfamily)
MKIRYVIDIEISEEYEHIDELQFKLKDELEEYVKDSEIGYYADKTSVKLQDDYCIKEEKRLLKAGRKALSHPTEKDGVE